MCSINGLSFNDYELIKKITFSNKYRGPDKTDFFLNEEISFGFNLLAFTYNPEHSSQPVFNKNQSLCLMFNGEIYNLIKLKKLLGIYEEISEANLLLKLYDKYGINFLKFIDGMFAIAIYDKKNKKIIISRDSLGIKPIYYVNKNKNFYFSSDINSLTTSNVASKKLNLYSVKKYLTYGVNFGEESIYNEISKVNPSQYIEYDLFTRSLVKKNYNVDRDYFENEHKDVGSDIISSTLNTLASKRKPCLLLSGGLDSNIIYSIAKFHNIEVNTLSTFFETNDQAANEDANIAKKIAKKSTHIELEISFKKYLELIEISPKDLHEPKYNKNQEIYNEVFREMSLNNIKLAITGDGADEIFSGYKMHLLNYFFNYKKIVKFEDFKYILKSLGKKKFLKLLFQSDEYDIFNTMYNLYEKKDKFFEKDLNKIIDRYSKSNIAYNNLSILELYTIVLEDFLMTKDNFGMAYSIEARFPFLNNCRQKSLELLPENKIDIKNDIYKKYLKNYFKNILPDIVLKKTKKTGWSIPNDWRENKNYKNLIKDILSKNYLENFNEFYQEQFHINDLNSLSNKIQTNLIHFKTWAKCHGAYF